MIRLCLSKMPRMMTRPTATLVSFQTPAHRSVGGDLQPLRVLGSRMLSESNGGNDRGEWYGVDNRRMERMAKITADASAQSHYALKDAYRFWLGKFSVEFAAKKGRHDKGHLNHARKILNYYYHEKKDPKLLEDLVCDTSQNKTAPNMGFVRLINLLLQPLEGTRALMQRARYHRGNAVKATTAEMIEALTEASEVASMMQKCHDDESYRKLVPDLNSYRGLLNLWYKRCRFLAHVESDQSWNPNRNEKLSIPLGGARSPRDCIERNDEIVESLENSKLKSLAPDVSCYIFQFTARAAGNIPGGAEECLVLLERIKTHKPKILTDSENDMKPICTSILMAFANEVEALMKEGRDTAAALQRASDWWDSMKPLSSLHDPFIYSSLMNVYSKAGDSWKTKEILDEMISRGVNVSTIHFNIALNACTVGASISVNEVESILRQMTEMHKSGFNTKPDRITYTSVILAFLRSSSKAGVAKAEEILESLERVEEGSESVLDSHLYSEFLAGLLFRQERAHEPQEREALALKMEEIFKRLCERGKVDKNFRGPRTRDLNLCLKAWARSRSASRIDRLVTLFERWRNGYLNSVDASTYRFMLLGLTSSFTPETLNYGKLLLRQMEEDGIPLHIGVMNQYARLLARFGEENESENYLESLERMYSDGLSKVRPQENTYRYILEEYWKKGEVHRAQRLFKRLKALGQERSDFRPSEKSYAAMIHAWTKSKDLKYLENVERLFAEVRSIWRPSSYTYSAYQIAWKHSGRRDSPIKVEAILNEMQQQYSSGKNPNCRPSTFNFAHVISSWARSGEKGSAERAGAILKQLETFYDHSGALDPLRPTEACYQGAIKAWSTVKSGEAGREVLAILDRMIDRHSTSSLSPLPSTLCYHSAMDATCSDGGQESILALSSLYEKMKIDYLRGNQYARPNAETYIVLFRLCSQALSSSAEAHLARELASDAMSDFIARGDLNKNIQVYAAYVSCISRIPHPTVPGDAILKEAISQFPDFVRASTELQALLREIKRDDNAAPTFNKSNDDDELVEQKHNVPVAAMK